ncbi:hypothetical protein KP77_12540 [Jeotgalibacillus alimentarius]|uniref:Uncharacterized protein n=1 Tax=Jeotgalibacillus alimentarius TaxID=135826 RepID=A0A0C2VS38_9BACL|nr:hypothetical protein [Jeotgalibacillus alimentarius]KIL51742.1 hypothetical protein KP77_12540 [Jeotgalibacillus alimentarius]
MKESIIILFIGLVFFLTACAPEESAVADIEMKSQEELSNMTDSYAREDYRQVMSHITQEAKSFEAGVVLEKWIIRTLAEEALYYEEDLSEEEVLEISRERLAEDLAWKNIASTKYGIIISRDELDEYINNITNLYESPLQLAYADILGLTVEQLNHEFDEDVYEKNLMWEKLKPELEKAYETSDQSELVERFNKEVNHEINR